MVQFFGESPRMPLEHEIGLYELSDPILSSAQGLHGSREDAPTIPRFPEKLVAPRACPRIAWERRVTILTDWRVSSSRPRSARSQRQGSSTRSNHGRFLFPAGVLADPPAAILFVPSGEFLDHAARKFQPPTAIRSPSRGRSSNQRAAVAVLQMPRVWSNYSARCDFLSPPAPRLYATVHNHRHPWKRWRLFLRPLCAKAHISKTGLAIVLRRFAPPRAAASLV